MEKPNISTIIVIICILIIGLYAAGEVNYFSHKIITEKNVASPVIVIEKVGIAEKINADVVLVIGSKAVLYKPNPEKPIIQLK